MTTLIRGELIKATTTRTIFAYGALAVALAVAQVLALILPAGGDPMSLADKTEAIAGLPLLVLLLGLVGAAGEYRHRAAAPAPPAKPGPGRPPPPRSSPVATAGPCCSRGRAPTLGRRSRWPRSPRR